MSQEPIDPSKSLQPPSTQGGWLSRLIGACGPWAAGLSDEASKRMAQHRARQAAVDVLREALSAEVKTLAKAREELLLRRAKAKDVERVRIDNDLKYITEEARKCRVYKVAFDYAPQAEQTEEPEQSKIALDEVWLDRFHEAARKCNEEWRVDLLAKALTEESKEPGRLGLRSLWLIGTMEERLFHAFSELLDMFLLFDGNWFIPDEDYATDYEVNNPKLGKLSLGQVIFLTAEVGLVGDPQMSGYSWKESPMEVSYADKKFEYSPDLPRWDKGVVLTQVGTQIARLHAPKPNNVGTRIFDNCRKRLNRGTPEAPRHRNG